MVVLGGGAVCYERGSGGVAGAAVPIFASSLEELEHGDLVQGVGLRVQGLGFGDLGFRFRVSSFGSRVLGVQDLGSRVQGLGFHRVLSASPSLLFENCPGVCVPRKPRYLRGEEHFRWGLRPFL